MYLIVVTALRKGEKGGQSMDSYFPIFEEIQAAKDAEELLENPSFLDQNVALMAKANYFKPLLRLLSAVKKVAVKALQNLSNAPKNGLQMIRKGAVGALFEILYRQNSLSSPHLREQAAVIIMNLANSILRTFLARSQSPSGEEIRAKLSQFSAVQGLVQSFHCLAEDGDNNIILEHITLWLLEAGAFQLFVVQEIVAEAEIIPMLVQLLVFGTALAKQSAAISLKQLSKSLSTLSSPVKRRGLFSCLAAPVIRCCPVHLGIYTVESSFCILQANAPEPLVRMLGEADLGVCEALLDALLTLVDGQRLQNGGKV
ncbi:hypothetical protein POTOM_050020 [Populus tomentosa]|uniref:ARM repeat superfamily protein n=1 Tax=Populus tomentosa TaxID=118781 RepID=A0A8X7Y9S7_POPTO|nr:hypothetical protein POTOM_050020 [Populus tomentosa]